MSDDLDPIDGNTALANLAAFGNAQGRSTFIKGDIVRHAKGYLFRGKEETELQPGVRFIACVPWILTGHQKWEDKKPAGLSIGMIASGFRSERLELGDLDKELWDVDDDGKPRDPWQPVNVLYLIDDEGEVCTFIASSVGAMGAIAELAKAYAKHALANPGKLPAVEIGVDWYKHRGRGRIFFPTINIVNGAWIDAKGIQDKLDAAGPHADADDDDNESTPATEVKPPADVQNTPRAAKDKLGDALQRTRL